MAPHPTEFVAILLYEDDTGWCHIEPLVFAVSHPEIAYQWALAKGKESRPSKRFVGLGDLFVKTEEVPPIATMRQMSAREHVTPKEQLSAFQDPRWLSVPHDPAELEAALREPPALVPLEGLDAIDWDRLSHAYGPARDVPLDLRRLASCDPNARKRALWELSGNIYHQGSVDTATAAAVPFLVQIATHPSLPERREILELLDAIADSAVADPEQIKKGWAWKKELFGERFRMPTEEMAEEDIEVRATLRSALRKCCDSLRPLRTDSDAEVRRLAAVILTKLSRP